MPGPRGVAGLIGALLAAPAAVAQPVLATASAPAPASDLAVVSVTTEPLPACELHVWPAARVGAMTQGVGAGFGLVGALIDTAAHADQNKRDTAFITGTLDASAQARVLRELDLPTRMHLRPSRIIIHDQGADIKSGDQRRLTDSTAPCYTEFVVRALSYFQNVLYRGQMRTFLEVRRFDGRIVKIDFSDSKHEVLAVKLPKEGEDTGPATNALLDAFRGDVAFFADKFARKYK